MAEQHQQPTEVFLGNQATKIYTFYTVVSCEQAFLLEKQGRFRVGRYTSLRMNEPAFHWDGVGDAIKRDEHVSGTLQGEWSAAEVVVLAAGGIPFPVASCSSGILSILRQPDSKVLLEVVFTPLGYAYFRHMQDLKQSWENWWRLHGELYLHCKDCHGEDLYVAHMHRLAGSTASDSARCL
jgi:hypothetical protein